jgi:hypothetical protein
MDVDDLDVNRVEKIFEREGERDSLEKKVPPYSIFGKNNDGHCMNLTSVGLACTFAVFASLSRTE